MKFKVSASWKASYARQKRGKVAVLGAHARVDISISLSLSIYIYIYSLRHSNFAHCAFAQPLHFGNYVAFAHCAANFQGQKENLIVSQISVGTKALKNKSQTARNEKVGFFKKCQFDCKKTIESQDFFENLMKRGSC